MRAPAASRASAPSAIGRARAGLAAISGWMTSAFVAQAICDAQHDLLVDGLHMKTAVVMSRLGLSSTEADQALARVQGRLDRLLP